MVRTMDFLWIHIPWVLCYIATGKRQDVPLDITEDNATISIFGNKSLSESTSGTVSLFHSPRNVASAQEQNNRTSHVFLPHTKEFPKVISHSPTTTKPAPKKMRLLPIIITLTIIASASAGLVYYFLGNEKDDKPEQSIVQSTSSDITDYNEYMEDATALMETAPNEAMPLLLLAQKLQPENPDPFVNYAYALYLSRDYASCIDYIENDLALGKAYDITYQSMLAEVLGQLILSSRIMPLRLLSSV